METKPSYTFNLSMPKETLEAFKNPVSLFDTLKSMAVKTPTPLGLLQNFQKVQTSGIEPFPIEGTDMAAYFITENGEWVGKKSD